MIRILQILILVILWPPFVSGEEASAPEPAVETVSVLYFTNTAKNTEYAWLSKGIADMLISDLSGSGKIQLVEREELEKVLKEQELGVSGFVSEKDAPKIGNLLGAGKLVYGSFIIQKDEIRIDARIVASESAKVAAASQARGKLDAIFDVERELASKILSGFGIDRAIPAGKETASIEAARAYYIGLDFFDSGKMSEALAQFEQASSIDPFYAKPLQSIEESYKFLKDFKTMQKKREIGKLVVKAMGLKKRLEADIFYSYADVITNPEKYGFSRESVKTIAKTNPELLSGDSPAQCTWNLIWTILEIADKSEEYFADTEKAGAMHNETIKLVEASRVRFAKDPFLPEILYTELFSFQYLGMWKEVKSACENLMLTYPDFRMMYAIEDFYERALEKLEQAE